MNYISKAPDDSVNIPKASPLFELIILLTGVAAILLILYYAMGFLVDFAIPRLPRSIDNKLGSLFSKNLCDLEPSEISNLKWPVQDIFNKLESLTDETGIKFHLCISDSSSVNAFALADGTIVALIGLIDEAQNEEELAYVLAHEIGHIMHRDQMRAMGRSIVVLALSVSLLGQDSSATNNLMNMMTGIELAYSRKQETAADAYAIDMLAKRYGHCGAGPSMMRRFAGKRDLPHMMQYFSTHPFPDDRIAAMTERIEQKGYKF